MNSADLDGFDFEGFARLFARAPIGEKTVITIKRQPVCKKLKVLVELGIIELCQVSHIDRVTKIKYARLV